MKRLDLFILLVLVLSTAGVGFALGVEHTRKQIRNLAEELANEPEGTNSFSRCVTEMWEQSGELDPAWKGQRRWHLK